MIKAKKTEDGDWEIIACGVSVGYVYYDTEAWSEYRYFIAGETQQRVWAGVGGKTKKAAGYRTLRAAAHHLAVMNSGQVLKEMATC